MSIRALVEHYINATALSDGDYGISVPKIDADDGHGADECVSGSAAVLRVGSVWQAHGAS